MWLGWQKNPTEIEQKYGTHPFGKPSYTEIFTGQHPEVMKNHPRFLEYIHKYKLKINMTVFPLQRDGFINISSKNNNIFETPLIMDNNKPFLVFIEDLLEHISFNTVGEFLIRIYDQMEINGEIIIKTLNLPEIIKRYAEGNLQYVDFIKLIYGNQTEANDYRSCCYDENSIKVLLDDVGFSNITVDKMENGLYLYIVGRKSKEYQKV